MKKLAVMLSVALLLGNTARGAESYLVVKVVNRADVEEFKVMTPAELKTLQAEIQAEARLIPKATALTRKAWDQDPENKSFPGGAISRRSADPVGPAFKEQSEAEERALNLTNAAVARQAELEEKAKEKLRSQYKRDKYKEKKAEAAAKESERKATDEKARALFEEQLKTLKSPTAAPDAAAP